MTFRNRREMSDILDRSALIILALLMACVACVADDYSDQADEEKPAVRIYLPRNRSVEKATITLADLAYISGENDKLVAKASKISLGRAPYPGESLALNRQTIQSRLAAAGIYSHDIKITGAKKITLTRESKAIASADFVNLAEECLRQHLSSKRIIWKLSKQPEALAMVARDAPRLSCQYDPNAPSGHAKVTVSVHTADGKKLLAQREVHFRLSYRTQQVVATSEIRQGEAITPENAKIKDVVVQRPPEKWVSPFGLKARKTIQKDAVVLMSLLEKPKPKVLVKRNRTVRIKVVGPGWRIVALGVAMQNGKCGDAIRVRNVDSKRIILAKVDEQGDVVPIQNRLRR